MTVDDAPTWSRGTRVFRRTNSRWSVIHQHRSFPLEPAIGQVATDLAP